MNYIDLALTLMTAIAMPHCQATSMRGYHRDITRHQMEPEEPNLNKLLETKDALLGILVGEEDAIKDPIEYEVDGSVVEEALETGVDANHQVLVLCQHLWKLVQGVEQQVARDISELCSLGATVMHVVNLVL